MGLKKIKSRKSLKSPSVPAKDHDTTGTKSSTAWEAKLTLVNSCESEDVGSQRCRLPCHVFIDKKIELGSYVKISSSGYSTVCRAFVWRNQVGNLIQADNTVSEGSRPKMFHSAELLELNPVELEEINVTVVLRGISFQFSKEKLLRKILFDIFSSFAVIENCVVNCALLPFCELFNITKVIVNKCRPCMMHEKDFVGVVLDRCTKINIDKIVSEDWYKMAQSSPHFTLPPLAGLNGPRQLLEDLLQMPDKLKSMGMRPQRGILLVGPTGTGKTTLVKTVARKLNASLVTIKGPDVYRPDPGESECALSEHFTRARALGEQGCCVLLLDEADSFLAKRDANSELPHGNRLVSRALGLLDELENYKGHMLVVATTKRPHAIDPNFRRLGRFDQEIYIGPPTKDERLCILRELTKEMAYEELDLSEVAELTPGYVGADLALLCQRVAQQNLVKVTTEDFRNALRTIRPSIQRSSFVKRDFNPVSWDDIGGLDDIKIRIKQAIEWPLKYAAAFNRMGLPCPKGVLLYGPPGCCKTTLVRAAATACRVNFVAVGAAEIFSAYVGESSRIISEVFHEARLLSPAIVFMDEVDALVGKRSTMGKHGVHEKILSTLLNEMDGIGTQLDSRTGSDLKILEGSHDENPDSVQKKYAVANNNVIVVGATNRPDLLDAALLRPGRFDKILYVPPPDCKARREILAVYTRKMPLENVVLEDLAVQTENFTGADLENLCREAALLALTEDMAAKVVTHDHFNAVLRNCSSSLSREQIAKYEKFKKA